MKNRRFIAILLAVVLLSLIPLIGMQFSEEVNWTLSDFMVTGSLMVTAGLLCEIVIRKVPDIQYRLVICFVVLAILLLIWAELAVGIFGTPFGGT